MLTLLLPKLFWFGVEIMQLLFPILLSIVFSIYLSCGKKKTKNDPPPPEDPITDTIASDEEQVSDETQETPPSEEASIDPQSQEDSSPSPAAIGESPEGSFLHGDQSCNDLGHKELACEFHGVDANCIEYLDVGSEFPDVVSDASSGKGGGGDVVVPPYEEEKPPAKFCKFKYFCLPQIEEPSRK